MVRDHHTQSGLPGGADALKGGDAVVHGENDGGVRPGLEDVLHAGGAHAIAVASPTVGELLHHGVQIRQAFQGDGAGAAAIAVVVPVDHNALPVPNSLPENIHRLVHAQHGIIAEHGLHVRGNEGADILPGPQPPLAENGEHLRTEALQAGIPQQFFGKGNVVVGVFSLHQNSSWLRRNSLFRLEGWDIQQIARPVVYPGEPAPL